MKKTARILAAAMMIVMIAASWGAAAAEQSPRRMETAADADEWISLFLGEHPEDLDGIWALSAQMEASVSVMGGIGSLAKQLSALGTPEEIFPAYEGEIRGLKAFFIPCVFSAMQADLILVVQDGAIAGLTTGVFSGKKEETAASDLYDAVDLALPVPSLGELPGVLTVPKEGGPFPVVILLQGSGSSDRDEAIGAQKPFRDLAEGLAACGVAVCRFDKRTYVFGAELAADLQFTPENEYIEDAVSAVRLMARQEQIDPERIFVLGHSLGGNMIPAVARALKEAGPSARGYIMMAASPRPLDVLMREQYDFLYSLLPEVTAELQAEKDALFAQLDKLQNLDSLADGEVIAGAYPAYWKWLAAYDVLESAKEMDDPVLLLQGEEDYQVTMADFAAWQDALGSRENWRMISYPGLTHTFVPGQKSEGSAVYTREGHVREDVIRDIASFVSGN